MKKHILAMVSILAMLGCGIHLPSPPQGDDTFSLTAITNVTEATFYTDDGQIQDAHIGSTGSISVLVRHPGFNACVKKPGWLTMCLAVPNSSVTTLHFTLTPTAPPVDEAPWDHVTPEQVKAIHAALSVPMPSLKLSCPEDPITGIRCTADNGRQPLGLIAGLFFTTHLGNYPDSQQEEILRRYKATACGSDPCTHMSLNIAGPNVRSYSGLYPGVDNSAANINKWLKVTWKAGLIPICIGWGVDDREGLQAARELAARLETPALCPLIMPGMEMNDGIPSDQRRIMTDRIANVHAAFPSAGIVIEFTPGHSAGDTPEPEWWGRGWKANDVFTDDTGHSYTHGYDWVGAINSGVIGQLYQSDTWDDPQVTANNLGGTLIRLGAGYRGWPHPLFVWWYETDTYVKFWNGRSLSASQAYNNAVLAQTYDRDWCEVGDGGVTWCARANGFGDGR